ncbi:MAG: hypothetical protein EOP48_00780 [Sphingobacteriales bacterium]|nr:MAG: hypothetical protein EOP48_00780 [Sphingobacteriales bacterium]
MDIPRPKKRLLLPKVLSEAELSRQFNVALFLKHKAILFTTHNAGLRVSEIVRRQSSQSAEKYGREVRNR